MSKILNQFFVFGWFCLSISVSAQTLDETIVYIECKAGDSKKVSRGSGVLISQNGIVLTAKHVIPDELGTYCEGVIGNAFQPKSKMIIRKKSINYDAALLQFSGKSGMPHVKYCKLDSSLQRATVFATGFPGKTNTGVPSSRVGVLSTVQPGPNGMIETDNATTRGMSGGMVTLGKSSNFIGIISGAHFDPGTGQPDYYGVLPAQELVSEFGSSGLVLEDSKCTVGSLDEVAWKTDDGQVKLGMHKDEGFCFLTDIWGVFNHSNDRVRVQINDGGQYFISGSNSGGGQHGATAQCVHF